LRSFLLVLEFAAAVRELVLERLRGSLRLRRFLQQAGHVDDADLRLRLRRAERHDAAAARVRKQAVTVLMRMERDTSESLAD
jgi:hypothetical protein